MDLGDLQMPMTGGFLDLITRGDIGIDEDIPVKKKVKYRECLKNQAASMGRHAVDGCGEFMAGGREGTAEALKCAACECHRNFHRREVEGESSCDCRQNSQDTPGKFQLSPAVVGSPSNAPTDSDDPDGGLSASNAAMKKRFRTKFSAEQKEKMASFATEVGWKINKNDEGPAKALCAEIGVTRHILKVWMHNNKPK